MASRGTDNPRGTPVKGTPAGGGGGGGPAGGGAAPPLRDATALAIRRIQKEREERRRSAEMHRREKEEEVARIEASGMPVFDADFQRMIAGFRSVAEPARPHAAPGEHEITVVVRKRPINRREVAARDWDAVTCLNPRVVVHAPKLKVDGITKYLENTAFEFDHTFDDASSTDDVYRYTVMPLVAYAFQKRGRGTCIAYGQTGSGKTFTVSGIQQNVARDVFRALQSKDFKDRGLTVHMSFLEIYGARCSDLLHSRNKVIIREDGKQRVVASGLEDVVCHSAEEMMEVISRGNAERATASTEVNSQSSRSHAICEISIRSRDGRTHGSLSLVDLAGSERAADSRNHNRQRRLEGAEINKSLLALKECIRALALRSSMAEEGTHLHVPFRASKLTMVLRDSFMSDNARVVMIATVSPNASSADHTQNTLRYADRVKEKSLGSAEDVEAAALLAEDEDDEAMEGKEDGAAAGGAGVGDGGKRGKGGAGAGVAGRPLDVTFSFLEGPPAGGKPFALPRGGGGGPVASMGPEAIVAPRMSPLVMMTEEGEGEGMAPKATVGAKQPPAAVAGGGAAATATGPRNGLKPSVAAVATSRHPVAVAPGRSTAEAKEGEDGGMEEALSPGGHAATGAARRVPVGEVGGPATRSRTAGGGGAPTPPTGRPSVPPPSAVAKPTAELPPLPGPAVMPVPTTGAAVGGGFRKLLARPGAGEGTSPGSAPSSSATAPPPATLMSAPAATKPAPASLAPAPPGGGEADARSKFRARGKMLRASVGSASALPNPAAALVGGSSSGTTAPTAPLPTIPMVEEDDMDLRDTDFDGEGAGASNAVATSGAAVRGGGAAGGRRDGGGGLIQSFMPLPGSRLPVHPPTNVQVPSPERDLALVHAMRRSELRSRGEGGGGGRASVGGVVGGGAGGSPVGKGGGTSVVPAATGGVKPTAAATAAGGGGGGESKLASPTRQALIAAEVAASPELSMQLTATAVLEAQEDLLNAHMQAIQENADLLTQEGKLLAGVQAGSADDFDIDAYASKLQGLLTRKLRTTQQLLNQLARLRDQWDKEEMLHRTMGEAEFDL